MSSPAFTHTPLAHAEHRLVAEESVNQLTHGLGLLLSIAGAIALAAVAAQSDDVWRVRGAAIYAATLVGVYAASTLSHSFLHRPHLRHFFRMIDQVCIFLLIAGTYTPFAFVYMRDGWLWGLTIVIWIYAIAGALYKMVFSYSKSVSALPFVLLGWLPTLATPEIIHRVPHDALALMIVGGLLYTVGTQFFARDHKYRYFHAVWHLLVVAASACHYAAIYHFVMA